MSDISGAILKLRKMKMSAMADMLEKQIEEPNYGLKSFEDRIIEMVDSEWNTRYNKKLNRFLKKATLRYPEASLDASIYDPSRNLDTDTINELAKCGWIDERKNLLITGKSSAGKTYLGSALGVCAIRQFKTVKYIKAGEMMDDLAKAEITGSAIDLVKEFTEYELLIIDDFGLMSLDIDKCRNLFNVMDYREGRGSTMIISQLPVKSWYPLFKDNTYADACMERMVRKAYRLEMQGSNMRMK